MRRLRRLAIDLSPLRASREFRLLWSGSVVSAIGSQFARVGLYVQVYALTGSPAAVGLLGVSGLIGSFGGVLVGSAFIDRHDRRVTLIWTELAAVGVSGVLFAGALAGDPPLWLLHAANAATWFLAAIHGPARQAAIPRLLADDEVPAAVALNQAGWQVSSIVGPAFAGLLIGTSGTAGCLRRRRRLVPRRVLLAAILLRPLPPDTVQTQRGMAAVSEGFRYLKQPSPAAVDVRHRSRRDDLREPAGAVPGDRRAAARIEGPRRWGCCSRRPRRARCC